MKRAISKKAENILRRVIAAILEEPNRFNMSTWGQFFDLEDNQTHTEATLYNDGISNNVSQKIPACRTTACIAGHCLTQSRAGVKLLKEAGAYEVLEGGLVKVDFDKIDTEARAAEVLGFDAEQAKRLFLLPEWDSSSNTGWPKQFSTRYNKAKSARKRARIAVEYLEHVIANGV